MPDNWTRRQTIIGDQDKFRGRPCASTGGWTRGGTGCSTYPRPNTQACAHASPPRARTYTRAPLCRAPAPQGSTISTQDSATARERERGRGRAGPTPRWLRGGCSSAAEQVGAAGTLSLSPSSSPSLVRQSVRGGGHWERPTAEVGRLQPEPECWHLDSCGDQEPEGARGGQGRVRDPWRPRPGDRQGARETDGAGSGQGPRRSDRNGESRLRRSRG